MKSPAPLLTAWLFLFALVSSMVAGEISAERAREIIAKPDGGKMEVEEMKVFTAGLSYEMVVKVEMKDGDPFEVKLTGEERWAEGKYIVGIIHFPENQTASMVVHWDEEDKVYRKVVFEVDGKVSRYVGTRIDGTRSLAWIMTTPSTHPSYTKSFGTETYEDDRSTWKAVYLDLGGVAMKEAGEAKVTKKR